MTLKVIVEDLGDRRSRREDRAGCDYLLITTLPCYLDNTQAYPKAGTHVLTIKGRTSNPRATCTHREPGMLHGHNLFDPTVASCSACGGEFTCDVFHGRLPG